MRGHLSWRKTVGLGVWVVILRGIIVSVEGVKNRWRELWLRLWGLIGVTVVLSAW